MSMKSKFTAILSIILISSLSTLRAQGDSDFEITDGATHVPAMVLVTDEDVDEVITILESQGVTILRHRKNILLALVPTNPAPGLRKVKGVEKIVYSPPRKAVPLMDQARLFNNANLIAEGRNLPMPFDGEGVVVGVCDIGMDTRHPNFLDVDLQECRIRRVVHYRELQGERKVYSTPSEIYDWQYDTDEDWHATHVVGIAAGAHKESGYYSLAPAADIVFTASQLSDVGLLAGVEDIIEYAKEVGKPAVVNLSMGNYTGPHDGTSLFSRYLDYCAEDAVICISAGNEGEDGSGRSMSFDFTSSKPEVRVRTAEWGGTDLTGTAEVWSADSTPFDFYFYWNNNTSFANRQDVYEVVRATEDETAEWRISADPDDPDFDETFASHHTEGYVEVKAGKSILNGRYYAEMNFKLKSETLHPGTAWAEYWPAIRVNGEEGTHVDIFCAGGSWLRRENGFPEPDNKLCISDLATGHKVVSVGMMNNTDIEDGRPEGSGYTKGDATVYSSYGTLADGRKLPLTVAPGAYVISSISSPFLEAVPEYIDYTDYHTDFNGKTVYWIGTLGTSMSCPFVVGAIATWLQAYPKLTSEEVIDIIAKTNVTTGYPKPEDPRHGQGRFDAYAGIQEVLKLASLNVSSVEDSPLSIKFHNNEVIVGNPLDGDMLLRVYRPDGVVVESRRLGNGISNVSLAHLPSGVYIINARTGSGQQQTLKARIR